MGATASTHRSGQKEIVPPWVYTVKIPPECAADHFGSCSDGMQVVGPNTINRHRSGHFETDGAKWSRGFTSGKHTFEIVFPSAHRGLQATVGVATAEAPTWEKGRVPLVGHNRHSWGICLRTRRSYHRNAVVKKFPSTQVFLPDKFYMYLDCDASSVQFGSDLDYYGTGISGLPKQLPLFPMVSACAQGANITIVYRGQGNISDLAPIPQLVAPGVVVVTTTTTTNPGVVAPGPAPPQALYPTPGAVVEVDPAAEKGGVVPPPPAYSQ